jgi:undecaprenyl-diphosphatase
VAVILYFWKDLWAIGKAFLLGLLHRQPFTEPQARLGWYLILATIPAGLLGILIKDQVEAAFASPLMTGVFLLVTAGLLLLAERTGKRTRTLDVMTWKDALWIGAAQAAAIFPGISRSGATITGGMLRDLERAGAARFSFLMTIPVMLAAGGLALTDLAEMPEMSAQLPTLALGFITAGVVGYLSIHWLLGYLKQRSLLGFSVYCTLVGVVTILFSLLR